MKKIILSAIAAMAIFFVSCSSPESKAVDLIKDATEKYQNAKTPEDLVTISADFIKEATALSESLSDDEKKALDESEAVKEATAAMEKAAKEASARIAAGN